MCLSRFYTMNFRIVDIVCIRFIKRNLYVNKGVLFYCFNTQANNCSVGMTTISTEISGESNGTAVCIRSTTDHRKVKICLITNTQYLDNKYWIFHTLKSIWLSEQNVSKNLICKTCIFFCGCCF